MEKEMRISTITCGLGLLALAAQPALANDSVLKAVKNPQNWAMQQGDYANQRYSKLDQINTKNVGSLRTAWSFSTGVLRGHEGSPLVIGNMMYLTTPFPNIVYALNLDDEQKIVWKYSPKQDPSVIPVMCCDTVNRGVQYADGKIFLYQADTTLVALDAKTGKELWKVVNGDPKKGETGTSAPLIVKDKVIVGISGAEFGIRGRLTAYNISDGKLAWRAYTTGSDHDILVDPEKTTSLGKPIGKDSSLKTWNGDEWKIGGGSTWGWYSYDPKLNLIYYGTANPGTWNSVQRAGPDGKPIDQKWTMTIFARDPDTGVAKWAYQMTPFDQWDYDGVNEMILVDNLDVKGQKHDVLIHFDRNGIAYTLDRKTGIPLVAEKFDPVVNWTSGIDLDPKSATYGRPKVVDAKSPFHGGQDDNTKDICPAALGAKDEQPASY
jgi:PQQ-dependent dehydrogenase (methanol/ethanol family)